MRRFALGAALAWLCVLATWQEVGAIILVWDDSGNDASKEWSITGNWDPDDLPSSADDLFIGVDDVGANVANAAGDVTLVNQNFTIDTLTVGNGADVDTSGNKLTVNGLTTIGGAGVSILVDPRSVGDQVGLDSEGITVNNDAVLRLNGESGSTAGGIVELESGLFQINPLGEAGGHGTIELIQAVAGEVMENSGRLFVSGRPGTIFQPVLPGTLTITRAGVGLGLIDLDGDNDEGVVDVDDGGLVLNSTSLTLVIDAALTDLFDGQMDIGSGDTVNITNAWTMGLDGILNFNGSGTHTLTGGLLTVNGAATEVNMNAGTTIFDSTLTVTDGNFALATDATVQFDNITTFADGTDFTTGDNPTIIVNAPVDIGDATVNAGEDFNWDGATILGQTTVNGSGDLDINVENIDAGGDSYGGVITMNSGNIDVQVADNVWVLGTAGTININNSANDVPVLSGDTIEIGNDTGVADANINVGGTGVSSIAAPLDFQSDADVNVAAGAILQTGTVTFNSVNAANNAEFTGTGTWRLTGANTVSETTTINMTGGTVDLDNSEIFALFANDTAVNAPLTINAATMANYGSSKTFLMSTSFSDLTVDSDGATGVLTVNLDDPNGEWTVTSVGIVNLTNDNNAATLLNGSDVNLNGTLNVTGDVQTNARLDIGATGIVNMLTASEGLRLIGGNALSDPYTIAGGTINGPGILRATSPSSLVGFGTINANVDFDDSSSLLADNDTLNVNTVVDVGTLGTADDDGVLNVIPAWNTNVAQVVDLSGGTLQGGIITNGGANGIRGDGLITAQIINNTQINAENNGTLIIDTPLDNNDWDGAGNTGELSAAAGNIEIRDSASFPFAGTVGAGLNRIVFVNGFELEFEPASTIEFFGGIYRSTHATRIGGTVMIGAAGGPSRLEIAGTTFFESGSSTALTGDLQLDGGTTGIDAGATFSGGGTLINMPGRTLTLVDGADVDILLENRGTLMLGLSPGQTQGLDFEQTATGTWDVELGGTGINDYDRMTLTGLASLDGGLSLSLIGGYVPSLAGPVLTILSASSVSGTFDVVNQPVGMPAGLMFDVIYNAGNVQLTVVSQLLGDYNRNGTVDAADYVAWRETQGQAVTPLSGADGDGDGTIDNDDYDLWRANFGNTAGSGSGASQTAAVPEPASFASLLLAIVGGSLARRRLF